MKTFISRSADETKNIGYQFGRRLSGNEVIALSGPLGSGKTTFAKGLAYGLGIKRTITSPTFSLIKSYQYSKNRISRTLYHIDLYRVDEKSTDDVLHGYLDDETRGVLIIEWPEKTSKRIRLKPNMTINFSYGKEGQRKIECV